MKIHIQFQCLHDTDYLGTIIRYVIQRTYPTLFAASGITLLPAAYLLQRRNPVTAYQTILVLYRIAKQVQHVHASTPAPVTAAQYPSTVAIRQLVTAYDALTPVLACICKCILTIPTYRLTAAKNRLVMPPA